MNAELLAGVDLGGTRLKVAVGRGDGTVLASRSVPTSGPDSDAVIAEMADLVRGAMRETGTASPPAAVGVGCPGLVDRQRGITRFLPNLPGAWRDVPLADRLAAGLGAPVFLLNDVRAATLAELRYGRGRVLGAADGAAAAPTLVLVALGTGIGGGVIVDGRLRLGPVGAAGEIGHVTVDPEGPPCSCGNRGCVETFASGPALVGEAVRLLRGGRLRRLHERLGGDLTRLDVEALGWAAEDGDADAQAIIERAARFLGIAISGSILALHPDAVLFAGGIANLGERLLAPVRAEVRVRAGGIVPVESVEIARSELGEQAGVLGAIALAACRGEL